MTFLLHRNVIVIIIDSVCQKLNIHSQSEKAEILRDLCNRFLNLPLTAKSQESKVWNVKKLSIIVIRLCLLTCIYVRDFINKCFQQEGNWLLQVGKTIRSELLCDKKAIC